MSTVDVNAYSLINQLSELQDLRQPWKVDHQLSDILLLTICAMIGGAKGWTEIADFGRMREDWLKEIGDFSEGIPSHDTIERVVSVVNAKHFHTIFSEWMQGCYKATDGAVVAIDGKAVRGSGDRKNRLDPIHMVSAFCSANGVVLAQVKTDAKSNEITAIPELLDLLSIKGCLVSLDAMGCQRDIAAKIREKEADYLLAVKGNQPRLHEAFKKHFPMQKILTGGFENTFETIEKNRGRHEHRVHIVSDIFDEFVNRSFDWKDMKTLGAVVAFRQVGVTPQKIEDVSIRYYISSADLTAEKLATSVRSHWSIENSLHYVLDVAMQEDACQIRRGDGAEILSGFRHTVQNLLKNETSFKAGIQRKMKCAAMNTDYMEKILDGAALLTSEAEQA